MYIIDIILVYLANLWCFVVLCGATLLGILLNHLTRPSKRGGPGGQNSSRSKKNENNCNNRNKRPGKVNIHSSKLCEPCDPLQLDSPIFYKYSQSLTLQPLAAPFFMAVDGGRVFAGQ